MPAGRHVLGIRSVAERWHVARIVLGLGSSHSPQLSSTVDWWEGHAEKDRRNPALLGRDGEFHTFPELDAVPEWQVPPERLTPEVWLGVHERAQTALEKLSRSLESAAPDVVVVIGDDQEEMFLADGMPTFAVYYGDTVQDIPPDEAKLSALTAASRAALWAVHGEQVEEYRIAGDLGRHVIETMMAEEFDVVALSRQPEGRSLGHAFTFVRRRLMGDRVVPMLPIALNSYNPPNQPSPKRCFDFGRAVRRAIESWPEDLAVAVVASGGLSHFVVDEELDRRVLGGLRDHDAAALTSVPRAYMRSGSSEILNWIAAGGALEHLTMDLVDYIPAYRSSAGTGVGMAFASWA
jgi:3-O-methylgallate 3,4-dioxygenase